MPPNVDPHAAMNPDDKGPPPDDPSEPDVGKRQRFLWQLSRSRLPLGSGHIMPLESLYNYERFKVRPIPEDRKESLLARVPQVLLSDFFPTEVSNVRWYGYWSSTALRDSNEKVVSRESTLHSVTAEWNIDEYRIRITGGVFSIRLPRLAYLQFRPRPPQSAFFEGNFDDYKNWEFVSEAAVYRALAEFFVLPFDSEEDFDMRGHVENCAGGSRGFCLHDRRGGGHPLSELSANRRQDISGFRRGE